MTSLKPKRIEILPESIGNVVAQYIELGRVAGEFTRVPTGEIYFHYVGYGRRWYVNGSMGALREAAAVFNRFCESVAENDDTDDPAVWAAVAAELRFEFEGIEPLGDPATSLWSATIEDSEGGLLSLY